MSINMWILVFLLVLLIPALIAVVIVNRTRKKTGYEAARHELLTSLSTSDVGMSCEDYSLISIAGPSSNDLPEDVRKKMQMHEESCEYHHSEKWHQSALGTLVTPEMENAASKTIEDLLNKGRS